MAGERTNDSADPTREHAQALIIEALDLLDAHGGSRSAAIHLALALDELRGRLNPINLRGHDRQAT